MRNYKKEINEFLEQYNTDLQECLDTISYSEMWVLQDAIYQALEISLQDINTEGDYWIEASYYSKQLGYRIVIDDEVCINQNVEGFIKDMLLLKEKAETLENKLMNKSDIELMLKIIDNYKDDAFYMAVENNNSLIGLEEIEALESKLKGLK